MGGKGMHSRSRGGNVQVWRISGYDCSICIEKRDCIFVLYTHISIV